MPFVYFCFLSKIVASASHCVFEPALAERNVLFEVYYLFLILFRS